ncbi:MAG: phenylacetate--CoA ligase family protein [Candidatus Eisenbacteria bacterium]|nr:phenylacetate--CoA ligase family protein [Candidatus Eisenbacteria bacterium]MCC7142618.1 phenylacetate--CoA ligase family protein [Candidatus Eisenbacteria bacterium]
MPHLALARVALLDRLRGLRAGQEYAFLTRSQWSGPEALRALQESKLRTLLDAAGRTSYYASRFELITRLERDADPWRVLASLPILTRTAAREEAAALRNPDRRTGSRPKSTGGSTGTPLRYVLSRQAQSAQWGHLWRAWSTAGFQPGEAIGIVAGRSLLAGRRTARRIYASLQNWITLDAFDLSDRSMDRFARALAQRRVRYLYGYASALATFADWLDANRRPLLLQAVFTTAEQLLPTARRTIERGARAEVFDTYGANDGGISAFECQHHDGWHLGIERCVVEVVRADGTECAPGEVGRVISTDLDNRAFPFLRYEVGDLAALDPTPCACGRSLPRLTRLSGRLSDLLSLPNGLQVHGELFSHLLRDEEGVRRYQAIQTGPNAIEVRLAVFDSRSEPLIDRLRTQLSALLPEVDLSLRVTDEFVHTAGGKVPLVVALDAGVETRDPAPPAI